MNLSTIILSKANVIDILQAIKKGTNSSVMLSGSMIAHSFLRLAWSPMLTREPINSSQNGSILLCEDVHGVNKSG